MAIQIQLRRDTASNWSSANPILAQGEVGLVIDSEPYVGKIGDGTTSWNSLPFSIGASQSPGGSDTNIQINEGGSFGGSSSITTSGDYSRLLLGGSSDDGISSLQVLGQTSLDAGQITTDGNGNLSVYTLQTTIGLVTYTSDAYSSLIIQPSGTDIAIGFGASAPDNNQGVAVGYNSNAQGGGTAIGANSNGYSGGVAIGNGSSGDFNGLAVGYGSNGNGGGVAIGANSNGSNNGAALGNYSDGDSYGAAVGQNSNGNSGGVGVGSGSNGNNGGVAVGSGSNGNSGGVAVGSGANTNGYNGCVAIGGDLNGVYAATIPGGFTLPTVQLGQGTAVLDGGLNFGTGANVYTVMDVNGALMPRVARTTYTGSVSGSAAYSMPFRGQSYKKFLINLQALHDAGGTITYPTAFTKQPYLYGDAAAVAVSSTSTTQLTLAVTVGVTGNVFVEGY